MRVYIYEERELLIKDLCEDLGVSPTKLVNELILYLDEQVRHKKEAKDIDDILRRFNRRWKRYNTYRGK